MRISTLAALLILTTVMLSMTACSQDTMAMLEDHSFERYSMPAPKYSTWNPAPVDPNTAYKYKDGPDHYANEAEVESVVSGDLPPPAPVAAPKTPPAKQNGSSLSTKNAFESGAVPTLRWPVQGKVVRHFGAEQSGVVNEGIAISTPYGMPIRAAAAGEVAYVGSALKDFGHMVILRHAGGTMTSYAHASAIMVAEGEKVEAGGLLGYVGKSGSATQPQLHFTLRMDDRTVDPIKYLPQQVAAR